MDFVIDMLKNWGVLFGVIMGICGFVLITAYLLDRVESSDARWYHFILMIAWFCLLVSAFVTFVGRLN